VLCDGTQPRHRWGRETVTTTTSRVPGTSSDVPAWRCVEVHCTRACRVTIQWSNEGTFKGRLSFDLPSSRRVYIYAAQFDLDVATHTGSGTFTWVLTDVPGPNREVYRASEVRAAGTHDSDTDADLRPPPFSTRALVERTDLTGSFLLTLYQGATVVAAHNQTTLPPDGVILTGVTRMVLVATGTAVRLTYIMEM